MNITTQNELAVLDSKKVEQYSISNKLGEKDCTLIASTGTRDYELGYFGAGTKKQNMELAKKVMHNILDMEEIGKTTYQIPTYEQAFDKYLAFEEESKSFENEVLDGNILM